MTALAVYVAVIVTDLRAGASWYEAILRRPVTDQDGRWACIRLPNGSSVELVEGDPTRPGSAFPSYGNDTGPAVLPGFGVEDPEAATIGLRVARRLPEWVVVVAPDGVRLVVTSDEGVGTGGSGLVGFRFTTPMPEAQHAFLTGLGVPAAVEAGAVGVVPVFASGRDALLTDPGGNPVQLIRNAPAQLHP
jgi:hypothetical protein